MTSLQTRDKAPTPQEGCAQANAEGIANAAPADQANSRSSVLSASFTAIAGMLSTYFIIACWSLYWLTAGAGALVHQRTRPIAALERTGLPARIDALFGQVMAVALPTRFHV